MRAEIRANLEREVKQRVEARNKDQVMEALLDVDAARACRKSLVEMEIAAACASARADLKQRGMKDAETVSRSPPTCSSRRPSAACALGLIVAELVRAEQPAGRSPSRCRRSSSRRRRATRSPPRWCTGIYSDRQRLAEIEAMVLENNVVEWVLGKAKVRETSRCRSTS